MVDEVTKLYARFDEQDLRVILSYKERLAAIYKREAVKVRSRQERPD